MNRRASQHVVRALGASMEENEGRSEDGKAKSGRTRRSRTRRPQDERFGRVEVARGLAITSTTRRRRFPWPARDRPR